MQTNLDTRTASRAIAFAAGKNANESRHSDHPAESLHLPQAKMQTNLDTRTASSVLALLQAKMQSNLDTRTKKSRTTNAVLDFRYMVKLRRDDALRRILSLGNGRLAKLDDQDNGTNQGDQVDEDPGPVLTGITQTSDSQCHAGNQSGQGVEAADDTQDGNQSGNDAYDKTYDAVKQKSHPITTERSSAGKIGVVFPHIQILFLGDSSLFLSLDNPIVLDEIFLVKREK